MIWLFLFLVSDPVLFQARMSEGVAALGRGDLRGAQVSFEAATKLADDPVRLDDAGANAGPREPGRPRGRLRRKLRRWAPTTREFFRRSQISIPNLPLTCGRRQVSARNMPIRRRQTQPHGAP